jgi:hypothetical protein
VNYLLDLNKIMNNLISEVFIDRELLISTNKVYLTKIHQYLRFNKKNTKDPILELIKKTQLDLDKNKLKDKNPLKIKLKKIDSKLLKNEILNEIKKINKDEKHNINLSDLLKNKNTDKKKSKDKNIEIKIKKISKSNKKNNSKIKFNSYENMVMQAEYNKLLESYQKFHNEYMNSQNDAYKENLYSSEEKKERKFEHGEELINYKERLDLAKSIQMNSLMGGAHNYVDPSLKELYKFWKVQSAFNRQLSFMMYDTLTN